jgi:hypothetical protein
MHPQLWRLFVRYLLVIQRFKDASGSFRLATSLGGKHRVFKVRYNVSALQVLVSIYRVIWPPMPIALPSR